ncbi:MAG: HEAT repeat domain-containing protein [Verrucomicrobiota bacterium]
MKLFNSKKAGVRIGAMWCLAGGTPEQIKMEVLRAALQDQSYRVRHDAVTHIMILRCRELVPQLAAAIDVESYEDVRDWMSIGKDLLTDGYCLRTDVEGKQTIHVLCRSGHVSTYLSKNKIKERGLPNIIEQWREFSG